MSQYTPDTSERHYTSPCTGIIDGHKRMIFVPQDTSDDIPPAREVAESASRIFCYKAIPVGAVMLTVEHS
jgi:hypothetical protein